jgi:hypothetical protein
VKNLPPAPLSFPALVQWTCRNAIENLRRRVSHALLVAARILVVTTMNFDGRRSSAAKTYDVDLSHSGRKIAKKPGESKGGFTD